MKLKAIHLFGLLVLFACSSCDKGEEVIPDPGPVDKTVIFEVFGNQDFSYSRYGEEEVRIQLMISRTNKDVADAIETIVFDSTFTMALKEIPVRAHKLVIKKTVPSVLAEKEDVFVGSQYTYRQESVGQNQFFPADQVERTFQLTVY